MTTPTVDRVVMMRRPRTKPSLYGLFAEKVAAQLELVDALPQPCTRYQTAPCAFADDVLSVRLWGKQREILEAVRDHLRVSVRSGHKCGKSTTAAVLALWFYFAFDDARVVLSSVTSRQVDQILWREIRKLRARSKQHITGSMHELARSGFKADAELGDFREIVGFTAREAEAVAGISGANLLYLLDEASGIPQEIFEAIEGNRAGGARLVMFSNPTRTEGEFYVSHTEKAIRPGNERGFYKTVHVSSEDTPNVVEGHVVIPGLATREWVEEKRLEWGEDSALYKIRVRGEFVESESGKIISVALIQEAEARWADPATSTQGRLHIGVDPAGEGANGDESAFAVRRGSKILKVFARRRLSDDAHVAEVLALISEFRLERDRVPLVTVDCEGEVGIAVTGKLRLRVSEKPGVPGPYELLAVKASARLGRPPYERVRDALWGGVRDWLRAGGALPEDAKLAKELHTPEWIELTGTGLVKATPKSELRKALGRSPDRADAVALAIWEPQAMLRGEAASDEEYSAAPARAGRLLEEEYFDGDDELAADRVFDPYAGGLR